MDDKDPDMSLLRRTRRLGERRRPRGGDDCVGSAESLSELVWLDPDDPDSVNHVSICAQRVGDRHSPCIFALVSVFDVGNGTELGPGSCLDSPAVDGMISATRL